MDKELINLLKRLSEEIFHAENFRAVPSAKRIKAAMAAVNRYTSCNLTSRASGRANCSVFEMPRSFKKKCVHCNKGVVFPPAP